MFLAAFGVLAEVDEDFAGGVEAFAGQRRHVEGGEGGGFEPAHAVLDHPDFDRGQGADGGRVIHAEDDAHFAHQRAGLADAGDLEAVAVDRQFPGYQHIELATGLAGLDQVFAGFEAPRRPGVGEGEEIGHVEAPVGGCLGSLVRSLA